MDYTLAVKSSDAISGGAPRWRGGHALMKEREDPR